MKFKILNISLIIFMAYSVIGNAQNDSLSYDSICLASFDYQTNGSQVSFYDQSWGNYETVAWDFGDGSSSNETNPAHTYASVGEYMVSLSIQGADCSNSVAILVWVGSNDSIVNDSSCVAYFGHEANGLQVSFYDQSWGNYETVAWDFGDGSSSNETNPAHTYASVGEYMVSLSIQGADCSNSVAIPVWVGSNDSIVNDSSCVAYFTYQSNELQVEFFNNSVGADSFEWNFGDGLSSYDVSPVHTYATSGVYTVTLSMSSENCSSVYSVDVFVDNNTWGDTTNTGGCYADFNYILDGLNVDFANLSSENLTSFYWNFGDGNTSIEENPSHIYEYAGTFVVSLTATDDSCSSTASTILYLDNGANDSLDFAFLPIVQANNTFVEFHNISSDSKSQYTWDFGDGNSTSGMTVNNTYEQVGVYRVSLTRDDGHSFKMDVDIENGTYWSATAATGLSSLEQEVVNVFPNPASDRLTINCDVKSSNVQVQIVNVDGTIVQVENIDSYNSTINIQNLSSGYYLLRITDGVSISRASFIKR